MVSISLNNLTDFTQIFDSEGCQPLFSFEHPRRGQVLQSNISQSRNGVRPPCPGALRIGSHSLFGTRQNLGCTFEKPKVSGTISRRGAGNWSIWFLRSVSCV